MQNLVPGISLEQQRGATPQTLSLRFKDVKRRRRKKRRLGGDYFKRQQTHTSVEKKVRTFVKKTTEYPNVKEKQSGLAKYCFTNIEPPKRGKGTFGAVEKRKKERKRRLELEQNWKLTFASIKTCRQNKIQKLRIPRSRIKDGEETKKRKFTLEGAEQRERERERHDRQRYYGTLESQPGD